jgi:taurine dioxygenase
MSPRHISIHPVSGALGAEIGGIDLSQPLDDAVFAEIRDAFHEHLVIFLHDQQIAPDAYLDFAKRFGPIGRYPFVQDMDGHPGITEVIKGKDDRVNFGGLWHSDTTYQEKPPLGSMLYAREVPPHGGDTLFANMYLAYETLSAGMRSMLNPLQAVYTAALRSQGGTGPRAQIAKMTGKGQNAESMDREAVHPVVRTHPATGRKALYVNCAHTSHFAGMTREESLPILRFLFEHQSRPEFTCRFRWRKNALAFWDNRCTHHYALNDYHGFRRLMLRITIEGETPA